MAQTQVYTLEAFLEDVRQVFASTRDPRAQAQGVAGHLTRLLAVPGWLEEKMNQAGEVTGRLDLHMDDRYGHPGPGFLVMCSRQGRGGATQSPHDHGAGFVVYGVYRGASEQTKYRWAYPEGAWTSPKLEVGQQFIIQAGQAAFFLPGEIHSTRSAAEEGETIIVRVESQKMEEVWRHRYDMEANSAIAFRG